MSEGIERTIGFVKATKLWLRAGLDYTDSKSYEVTEIPTIPEALSQGGLVCQFDTNSISVILNANNNWYLQMLNTFTNEAHRFDNLSDEDVVEVLVNAKTHADVTKKAMLKFLAGHFGSSEQTVDSDKPF